MIKTYGAIPNDRSAAEAFATGTTADQIRSVRSADMDLYWYAKGIVAGFSHVQMCEADAAVRVGIDLWWYTRALKAGITDRQVRAVHAKGFNVRVYTELRGVATDAEARDAIDLLGDRVADYLNLRRMGHRHRSALNVCADLPF